MDQRALFAVDLALLSVGVVTLFDIHCRVERRTWLDSAQNCSSFLSLDPCQVLSGTNSKPTATVTLYDTELQKEGCIAALGTGPVDAVYKAIDGLIGVTGSKLLEYSVARCVLGVLRWVFCIELQAFGLRVKFRVWNSLESESLVSCRTPVPNALQQNTSLSLYWYSLCKVEREACTSDSLRFFFPAHFQRAHMCISSHVCSSLVDGHF